MPYAVTLIPKKSSSLSMDNYRNKTHTMLASIHPMGNCSSRMHSPVRLIKRISKDHYKNKILLQSLELCEKNSNLKNTRNVPEIFKFKIAIA